MTEASARVRNPGAGAGAGAGGAGGGGDAGGGEFAVEAGAWNGAVGGIEPGAEVRGGAGVEVQTGAIAEVAALVGEEVAAGEEVAVSATGQPVWIRVLSAARIEELTARAPEGGPLSGIRFAVKDNIDVAGEPTSAAFRPLASVSVPTSASGPVSVSAPVPASSAAIETAFETAPVSVALHSATAVQRLISAGAVPVGKTNLDQFATGLVGTRTPYGACHAVGHPEYVSGGSSSGSAVAVALGLVPLALGTDTAGSGRVPAAFNGIVGLKPTRGVISATGVIPACRSLDCVSVFTRTVSLARTAFSVLAAPDPQDPYSRARPAHQPLVAIEPRVIAVPGAPLSLEPPHRVAWEAALSHAHEVAQRVVTFDPAPFLDAATLLYQGPWIAERWHAIAPYLGSAGLDHADLDPAVRAVLRGAENVTGAAVFAGLDRLAALRRATEGLWDVADAMLLPVTPGHPTHAEVAADPIGANSRLGTFTNFVNLLDLCAVAVPAGLRPDGQPFGVQLIAPAFHDEVLLDLAARWTGEGVTTPGVSQGSTLLAVVGAHLSRLALNGQLLALGARLRYRTRTAPGYRLYRLPGSGTTRPGLVHTGDGPDAGIAAEVWQLDHRAVGALLDTVPAPLGFGRVALVGGETVLGFLVHGSVPDGAEDVSRHGGWREYLAAAVRGV